MYIYRALLFFRNAKDWASPILLLIVMEDTRS